jgi:queuine tRNA-ribosyltransferase
LEGPRFYAAQVYGLSLCTLGAESLKAAPGAAFSVSESGNDSLAGGSADGRPGVGASRVDIPLLHTILNSSRRSGGWPGSASLLSARPRAGSLRRGSAVPPWRLEYLVVWLARPAAAGPQALYSRAMFGFEVLGRCGRARAGLLRTPHGTVETPTFMPVGTQAGVKAVTQRQLSETGARIVLANTYHLMLRPGEQLVAELGGLHGFTGWRGPFLTDSGGYQVFSLASLRRISEEGVRFQSHIDGSAHLLSPERSMAVQQALGADIVMAFDECPPYPAAQAEVEEATARTTRWARRSREAHRRADQWLFGIVQGGVFAELREKSAAEIVALDFPGYAIGGLSVGEPKADMLRVLGQLDPLLPDERPRYLMGVGTPLDIVEAVARGVDMFDCVLPTRNARNGQLFTSEGRLSIRNARFRRDPRPPDAACGCYTCRTASRAYLRHLHLAGEMAAATLLTIHNLTHYLDTLKEVRQAILLGRFEDFRSQTHRKLRAADPGPTSRVPDE